WKDPHERHDLVVFIGEAQPPLGRYTFCRRLIEVAQELGVERGFTFAAMATELRPGDAPRGFAAATDETTLAPFRQLELEIMETGQIGGLNGILLGVASEMGLRGGCLLGEMPHLFTQFPFPAASGAVLRVFAKKAEIDLDLVELAEQADAVGRQL